MTGLLDAPEILTDPATGQHSCAACGQSLVHACWDWARIVDPATGDYHHKTCAVYRARLAEAGARFKSVWDATLERSRSTGRYDG